MKQLLILPLVLLLIIARPSSAQSVDSLIQSLGDPDPTTREKTENALRDLAKDTEKGTGVRPALIAASRSGSPAISAAAAKVLVSLPWLQPDDPPEVKSQLLAYPLVAETGRIGLIHQMANMPRDVGWPTLLRLLQEEPSDAVCWAIASQFHTRSTPQASVIPKFRFAFDSVASASLGELIRQKLADPGDFAPAILLAARAWEAKDHQKALQLYRRAIDAEVQRPTQDSGELDEAYDVLSMDAISNKDFDRAADILRMQCARVSASQPDIEPPAVFALFVLHSRYGPLEGFAQDLQTFSAYTGSPEVLYALSKAYSRAGRVMESLAFQHTAGATNLLADERLSLVLWLSQLGWTDFARQEAIAILTNTDPDTLPIRADAHDRLAQMAIEQDNPSAALGHLQQAIDLSGGETTTAGKAQLALLQARVAQEKHDDAAVRKNLSDIVDLHPQNYEVVLKAFPMLKAIGREADALKLFNERFSTEQRNLIELGREDAEQFNNIAWLCSQCDQRLNEAAEYAKKAVAADPYNAAYLDTLADVQFRLGNHSEAIDLESRALLLRPDDAFMRKQLDRFKAGSTKP